MKTRIKKKSIPFERFHQHLLSFPEFLFRVVKYSSLALVLISIALCFGMIGYHWFEKMSCVDAFVNSSMILSGMGPVSTLATTGGKIFAGCYAIFSGLFFILIMGIIFTPVIHRFFHKWHQIENYMFLMR